MESILIFILFLSILILVHELGHFIMAKIQGVQVEEFALGLPFTGPLISKTLESGMKLSLYPLLFGGFVKLKGEDEEEKTNDSNSFANKKPIQRAAIVVAGVTMNFILAVALISFVFTRGVFVPSDKVFIENTADNSPAKSAGLQRGDLVLKIQEREVKTGEDIIDETRKNLGREVWLTIKSPDNQVKNVHLEARKDPPQNEGPLGIQINSYEIKKYPWYEAPFYGTLQTLKITGLMLNGLKNLFFDLITQGKISRDIAGPVGIAKIISEAPPDLIVKLQLLAMFSLNLTILNILPFPALDGGRLLFIAIEGLTGKKVSPKIEARIHQTGMIFLLGLIILITYQDISRVLTAGSILDRIKR